MQYIRALLSFFLLSCFLSPAYAYTTHTELTAAIGYAQANFNNINLPVTAAETDILHQTNVSSTSITAFGFSYHFIDLIQARCLNKIHDLGIGLNLYNLSFANKGEVYQFGDAALNNFNYNLPISTTRLMVDGKMMTSAWHHIAPFLTGGIGLSWNRIKYYDATTLPGVTGISLENREQMKFAYEIGAGLQASVSRCASVFIEYLYANLGDTRTSVHGNTTLVGPIVTPLHVNAVLAGINFSV